MYRTLKEGTKKKIIISGHVVDFYDFTVPYETGRVVVHDSVELNDISEKDFKNLKRARENVRRIIWSNISPYTKLLTLTTANTVLNRDDFLYMLKLFQKNMTRSGYPLRWLRVLERQEKRGEREGNEGSFHAHFIVFNEEKIPYPILKQAWKYGSVDIQLLKGLRTGKDELVQNAAAYICKYITKQNIAEFGDKVYSTSRGLKRPQEFRVKADYDLSDKILEIDREQNHIIEEILSEMKITYRNYKEIVANGEHLNNCMHIQGVLTDEQIQKLQTKGIIDL